MVTEAGFGADLGAEKFLDIKCRKAGLHPDAVVLVATTKALKMHGGVAKSDLKGENVEAITQAAAKTSGRHIRNLGQFGVPVTVAINHYASRTPDAEHQAIKKLLRPVQRRLHGIVALGAWRQRRNRSWQQAVVDLIGEPKIAVSPAVYGRNVPLWDKVRTIARSIYGAEDMHRGQEGAPASSAEL